ncbi:beta-phosphoglucomutase-like phosphatase (HAD superfamily) [Silvimonas terrae]|uniref:Beta-phosphoglucomutase-like phosphatase (HAD superfamily) n=1 Tax=Silvimonas terrae TaxID=300266 RepID=A0A840RMC4_9NEIS|nr:HAD family hydrolase [Silvimonas terrae]MBB5193426.1 beta-phosphoglucomutase-like phosphatase (HAD superfamily) [Silvimonas terrae]
MSAVELVCFDLDGTLVDSERLCNQAFLELLPQLDETLEGMVARYRGVKFAPIAADLSRRIGHPLPDDFEARYRARVAQLFDDELVPMPGVLDMIRQLSLPFCLVSNGPLAKMRHALTVTGLAPYLGSVCIVLTTWVSGSLIRVCSCTWPHNTGRHQRNAWWWKIARPA